MNAAPVHINVLIPTFSVALPHSLPHLSSFNQLFPPLASLRLVGRTCLIGVTRFLSSLQKLMGLFFFSNPAFNQAQFILSLLFLMLFQIYPIAFSSVPFSCSLVSDSFQPHGPQHTRPPCPTPTPRVYSNSRPLSR